MNKICFLNSSLILFPMFVYLLILLSMTKTLASSSSTAPSYGNESDLKALLDFKSLITEDPGGTMKLWNGSFHFCNWFGITCAPRNQRVLVLSLENQGLVGSLPPSIGNLTRLTRINLRNNGFRGEIPPELGRLLYLRHVNLTYNSFGGKIPTNISHCTELRVLDLNYNQLVGTVPDQLRSLTKLTLLGFGRNNLTGIIPAWIGNFSSLYGLSLAINNLHGTIPNELGWLKNLGIFLLWGNNLSGIVPPSIYNISSMLYFTVAQNQLEGELPQDIGSTLPNLQVFACGVNKFTGHIPASFLNASRLQILDVAQNGLTGALPLSIGRLRNLSRLDFSDNRLGSGKSGDLDVISSLVNCTSLEYLGLTRNFFGGELPKSIANLSTRLHTLNMGSNLLYGRIPNGIGNLVDLTLLGFEGNSLTGNIPDELGKLNKLKGLYLNVNKFSGKIPSSLGNLTSLLRVFMEENRIDGSIPPSLGRWRSLLVLNLSSNNLNGSIPREIIGISSLSISLTLSNNSLTGLLPSEVGELDSLSELDVSRNKLSSEIPSSLGKCISLSSLHLEDNEFEGKIPESLKSLRGLEYVNLSRNNLSGPIPKFLSKFSSLKYIDLAHNNFEGEVSKEGIFSNATAVSVLGNDRLCGGVTELRLPKCPNEKENSHSSREIFSPKVVIPVVSIAALVIILFILLYFRYALRGLRRKHSASSSSMEDGNFHVSYSDLAESTNGFSAENLIGSGSFGSVYKGMLVTNRKLVAVKVLNLQIQGALKTFIAECEALRSIRHRNLLKIVTACSSIDHQGNDFRSLVFEYMANGNLDEWLHPRTNERYGIKRLNFIQRLNIAIDVASALDYLHNYCQTPIVHCDLKPSNVLLDHDMVAHVGDFGLATFLFEASENFPKSQTLSVALKGSIGYIPPEYGMGGKVSVLGDSYSYGILLLEMFTGKRPTNDLFKDGLSIHHFTLMALPDRVMDIVDPSLLLYEENYGDDYDDERDESDIEEQTIMEARNDHKFSGEERVEKFLVSIMQIGLLCSNESPRERLVMSDVLNKMIAIRDSYIKSKNSTKG